MTDLERLIAELKELPRYETGEFDEGGGIMVPFADETDGGRWVSSSDVDELLEKWVNISANRRVDNMF